MTNNTTSKITHPTKFSPSVIAAIQPILHAHYMGAEHRCGRTYKVLDPFAGIGGVHVLNHTKQTLVTIGIELEKEWADAHPRNQQGDATALPFEDEWIDAVITSPSYGNRMADAYDGRGKCKLCEGNGIVRARVDYKGQEGYIDELCERCAGNGVDSSKRMTYRLSLGRPLTKGSGAGLQWGNGYRQLHQVAAGEMHRVLRPGGLIVVNMSNHIRKGREMDVVGWWHMVLAKVGFRGITRQQVETPRMRMGENHQLRVECEELIVGRKPA